MDPNFLRRSITGSAVVILFMITAVGVLHFIVNMATDDATVGISFGWLWLVPVVVGIPLIAWPSLSVPRKGYAVRDRDIVYKSGVYWRTVTAIPFNRIQHVEKSSTPLDRRFRIATLQLFTAGGSGGDLKIHGLSARAAEKLRVFILEKTGASIEQG